MVVLQIGFGRPQSKSTTRKKLTDSCQKVGVRFF